MRDQSRGSLCSQHREEPLCAKPFTCLENLGVASFDPRQPTGLAGRNIETGPATFYEVALSRPDRHGLAPSVRPVVLPVDLDCQPNTGPKLVAGLSDVLERASKGLELRIAQGF